MNNYPILKSKSDHSFLEHLISTMIKYFIKIMICKELGGYLREAKTIVTCFSINNVENICLLHFVREKVGLI